MYNFKNFSDTVPKSICSIIPLILLSYMTCKKTNHLRYANLGIIFIMYNYNLV